MLSHKYMKKEIKEIEAIAEEYYSTENQLKILEAKKEKLREILAIHTPDEGYASTFFKTSWTSRKTWEYSDKVKEMETELKKEQKLQQLEGAKFKETKIFKVELY